MKLLSLLEHTYLTGGFTTRSNYARDNTETIAQAACQGYLTIDTPRDGWGCVWRLTVNGSILLERSAHELNTTSDEEQRRVQQEATFRKVEAESSDAILSQPMSWFEEIASQYSGSSPTGIHQFGGGYDTAPYHAR